MKRRAFIEATTAASVGLIIGFRLDRAFGEEPAGAAIPSPFDAWIRIDESSRVTLICDKSEMGQGIHTALGQILAEELDVEWSHVNIEQAPTNPAIYKHLTGGSGSVRRSYLPLRHAAATARTMLVAAGARRFGVDPAGCRAALGEVVHGETSRRLTYGELAAEAAKLPLPDPSQLALKDPAGFRIVGMSIPRTDIPSKVDGTATYGIDVRVPGMLFAMVARCPTFGGALRSFEDAKAKAVPGVRHVVAIPPLPRDVFTTGGVAVVADSTWSALQGRAALRVDWDNGPHAGESDATLRATFGDLLDKPAAVVRNDGDILAALAGAAPRVEAVYELPFQAHAAMEPLNATVHVRPDRAEAWLGTQTPDWGQRVIAEVAGLPPAAVTVHTTLMGGGFGRRATADYIAEAAQVSKAVGAPVQLLWSREDDMTHDFYRPAAMQRLSAALDGSGRPVAWMNRVAVVSIDSMWAAPDKPRRTELEGAVDMPYGIPNVRIEYAEAPSGVPRGWWRSVDDSGNTFVTESFIDELATAAKADPLEFRLRLLAEPRTIRSASEDDPDAAALETERLKVCLQLAAAKAGWGRTPPAGRARGIAVQFAFHSYVAEVAEVSLENGALRVHRVVAAIDCGRAINPDTVAAQVEGAIVYGLSAALKGAITIAAGRAEQRNFHEFEVIRIADMPAVEVHIVPSDRPPTGVGEPGLPPIAAAVGNALFALTGKRVRRLPIRKADVAG
jgi:isoquinoline 1-oxidoreductase subunit beta